MIRCRDAGRADWRPGAVREEGIQSRPRFRESILGYPGGPVARRKPLGAEPLALVVDGARAVEEGVDINACASVAASPRTGMDQEEGTVELHRVVVCDGAAVFEGADAREVGRCRLPRGLG